MFKAEPYLLEVAQLSTNQPEKFAVLAIYPHRRSPQGGCIAVVLSLHLTEDAARRMVEDGAVVAVCQ